MFELYKALRNYKPKNVKIEACSICQLNCEDCYMRKYNSGLPYGVGKGYLKAKDFEKFLQMNPYVERIELSNNGEIFLNPELEEIIKIAYKYQILNGHQILLTGYNGVNFNNVSDKVLEALVKYNNIMALTLSIDGASQEIYSKYRRNGNFEKVIENIKKLNEYKKKYNSKFPQLLWQYIINKYDYDINEIKKAKKIAKELDMEIFFKKDQPGITENGDGFIPPNIEEIEQETGLNYSSKLLFEKNIELNKTRWLPCRDLFNEPQINYDGIFLGCTCKFKNLYKDNVFELGLEKVLKSKVVKQTKKMLMGKYKDKDFIKSFPCYNCWFYQKMKKENDFITKEEVKNMK